MGELPGSHLQRHSPAGPTRPWAVLLHVFPHLPQGGAESHKFRTVPGIVYLQDPLVLILTFCATVVLPGHAFGCFAGPSFYITVLNTSTVLIRISEAVPVLD